MSDHKFLPLNTACSWPTFNALTETLLIAYQSILNTTNQ